MMDDEGDDDDDHPPCVDLLRAERQLKRTIEAKSVSMVMTDDG